MAAKIEYKPCNCKRKNKIVSYEYVKIEKSKVTDYSRYVFEPLYCPFCGKRLK